MTDLHMEAVMAILRATEGQHGIDTWAFAEATFQLTPANISCSCRVVLVTIRQVIDPHSLGMLVLV